MPVVSPSESAGKIARFAQNRDRKGANAEPAVSPAESSNTTTGVARKTARSTGLVAALLLCGAGDRFLSPALAGDNDLPSVADHRRRWSAPPGTRRYSPLLRAQTTSEARREPRLEVHQPYNYVYVFSPPNCVSQ